MVKSLRDSRLDFETRKYYGTAGTSQGNNKYGFIPAFMDTTAGDIYLSRKPDGSLAKVHLLDGLPEHLIVSKENDQVRAVQKSVVAGFVLNENFFTRDEAVQFVTEKNCKSA